VRGTATLFHAFEGVGSPSAMHVLEESSAGPLLFPTKLSSALSFTAAAALVAEDYDKAFANDAQLLAGGTRRERATLTAPALSPIPDEAALSSLPPSPVTRPGGLFPRPAGGGIGQEAKLAAAATFDTAPAGSALVAPAPGSQGEQGPNVSHFSIKAVMRRDEQPPPLRTLTSVSSCASAAAPQQQGSQNTAAMAPPATSAAPPFSLQLQQTVQQPCAPLVHSQQEEASSGMYGDAGSPVKSARGGGCDRRQPPPPATAPSGGGPTADDHYARAHLARRQGDYAAAVREYTRTIELDARHFKALFDRAFIYDKVRRHALVHDQGHAGKHASVDVPTCAATASMRPPSADTLTVNPAGSSHVAQLGEHGKALEDLQRAIQLRPGNAFAHYNCGIVRDRLEDYSGAVVAFSTAIGLDPTNADFYHNRGFSYRKMVGRVDGNELLPISTS
jgi:tetratricopeptide (TPR) repeat protein